MQFDYNKVDPESLFQELSTLLGEPIHNEWHITNGKVYLPSSLTTTERDAAFAAIEAHQIPAALLARAKEQAKQVLFGLAEQKGLAPYKNITRAEADSWPSKGAEFDAWSLDSNAPCPILSLEAQHRGETLADYMTLKVGPKVGQYRAFVAALTAAQAILEGEITALIDESALGLWEQGMRDHFTNQFISLLPI